MKHTNSHIDWLPACVARDFCNPEDPDALGDDSSFFAVTQQQWRADVGDSDMAAGTETPDAEATRRTRILTMRSDPAVPNEEGPKKMRIWSEQSCQNSWRSVQEILLLLR